MSKRRNERGVAMVEAALVFPLVMLLILGILESALMFRTYLSATNASNGGARVGSIDGQATFTDYDILQAVVKDSPGISENEKVVHQEQLEICELQIAILRRLEDEGRTALQEMDRE